MSTNPEKDLGPVLDSLVNAPLIVLQAAEMGLLGKETIAQHSQTKHHEAYEELSRADEAMGL